LSSGPISYFYFKELKIIGSNSPIAIEIDNKPYATVIDVQNTIV